MTWVIDASTNEKEVAWRRQEDGFIVAFARKGLGEPFSDDKAPPDFIDKYAPPVAIAEAPVLADAQSRADAAKSIAILRAEIDSLEIALLGR